MPSPLSSLAALQVTTPSLVGDSLSVDSSVLPFIILADVNTLRIEISFASQIQILGSFTNVTVNNTNYHQFTGSINLDPTVLNTQILLLGRNYNPANSWIAAASRVVGETFVDPNGNVQLVTIAGSSALIQPTWSLVLNGLTTDGSVTWKNIGQLAISPTKKFSIIFFSSGNAIRIGPPSAVRAYKGPTSCKLEWAVPLFSGTFLGVRVMLSSDPTGITVPFTQFGDLVNNVTRSEDVVISSDTETTVDGNQTIVTTTSSTQEVNYGSVVINSSDVNTNIFYALVSTVMEDPVTNSIYESTQNGPVLCGFVDLKKANPTDFIALQRKEDIAGRIIAQVTRNYPDLDLTARSELRDLMVDPFSVETSNMSVREWFARASQSISAVSQIDDANKDGFSDTFQESPIKQQLAKAFGFSSDGIQALINKQFDLLGEPAGIVRGGSSNSVTRVTFYTYQVPTQTANFQAGVVVSTVPDSNTPSLTFVTRGSATVVPSSAEAFYDPTQGWWAVTVPAECQSVGKVGNVGARTIRNIVTGAPSGWNVLNLVRADNGRDKESNNDYAARIQDRLVTGVDSGSAKGYLQLARETPGIIKAQVVAANDLDMLRDWDPLRKKHIFGTVDIYTRGTTISEQVEQVPFVYQVVGTPGVYDTYTTLQLLDHTKLKFSINGFAFLPFLPYTAVELRVQNGSQSFFLGTKNAQFDNTNGHMILDPTEFSYEYIGDSISLTKQNHKINGVDATNLAAVAAISGASVNIGTYQLLLRLQSPLSRVSQFQPVLGVNSISGPTTGVIDSNITRLRKVADFLLLGGSNEAGDTIEIDSTISSLATKTIKFTSATMLVDSGMDISIDPNGVPGNVLSVRSLDLTTLYQFGIDYTIVPLDKYRTYGIKLKTGGAIALQATVLVAYNKFNLIENLTLNSQELVVLQGTIPTFLRNKGFVKNTWLPESHGQTSLILDSVLISAGIPYKNRYLKVTFNNGITDVVMKEGVDYFLEVDSVSGATSIKRIITGKIPDKGTVKVTYFTTEVFSISSEFPAFVEQLVGKVAASKNAGADVVVKSMLANAVDLSLVVELNTNADPAVIDPRIRTVIGTVFDNATDQLSQSELVRQIKAINGVKNVRIPLTKCARSNGSYEVGFILPTNTEWIVLNQDPAFLSQLTIPARAFITSASVLPNATIPGGGLVDSYVGLLFEGESYRRSFSLQDFLQNSTVPSFYIVGVNDKIDINTPLNNFLGDGKSFDYPGRVLITLPNTVGNPALQAYRITYQTFNNDGADDITISNTEYLVPGKILVNYVTGA
jgi:hypothetical protein